MKLLNVRLIDNGAVQERVDLEIEGTQIKAVTPTGEHAAANGNNPAMTDSLDLAGKTVIPGLINLHIHIMMDAGNNPEAGLGQPVAYLVLQAARRAQAML
jgi:imidazolonepropionase-like amidohydrolase